MKPSPLIVTLVIGGAFLILVAIVFFSRSDDQPQQITSDVIEDVQPSADNVDPTYHARLMALKAEVDAAPSDTSKLIELARLYQDGHQMVEAAEAYERLLTIAPDHRQAHLDVALCYSELGQWQDAEGAMTRMLAQYPSDPSALYNLGAIHANQGQYDEAQEVWLLVQAQTDDAHLAAQASASLEQLVALRSAPASNQAGTAGQPDNASMPRPSEHPPIPLDENGYQPVIAGQ